MYRICNLSQSTYVHCILNWCKLICAIHYYKSWGSAYRVISQKHNKIGVGRFTELTHDSAESPQFGQWLSQILGRFGIYANSHFSICWICKLINLDLLSLRELIYIYNFINIIYNIYIYISKYIKNNLNEKLTLPHDRVDSLKSSCFELRELGPSSKFSNLE